ncbi:MAG TPA: hypothetical protein VJ385_14555 [Fibrobacteria bacterium]|nr:hypothetical protein [Fibrobacteria bacterium]
MMRRILRPIRLCYCLVSIAAAGDAARDAWEFVLRAPPGDAPLDRRITALQKTLRGVPAGSPRLEELGWLFIAKARAGFDEGYYRQAEQCALLLDAARPGSPAALLLRGHALQSMHRFAEAEAAAKTLAASRGLAYDFGLLGDALMEQGKLDSALAAYQAMMDRKPGYQAYARSAHMRWLYGDVEGAAGMMAMAVSACSPRDPEALAWAYVKSAAYQWQSGRNAAATASCAAALDRMPGYAPALLLRGRIHLAQGRSAAALADLAASARAHPLPEGLWALADALRQAGRAASADSVEAVLASSGARRDPRTFSLYRSTRLSARPAASDSAFPGDAAEALAYARRELSNRGDVFTHDAVAWAAYASGDLPAASSHADSALARGTRDARLYLHAGIIARAAGEKAKARARLQSARALARMLLPSERRLLEKALARPAAGPPASAAGA